MAQINGNPVSSIGPATEVLYKPANTTSSSTVDAAGRVGETLEKDAKDSTDIAGAGTTDATDPADVADATGVIDTEDATDTRPAVIILARSHSGHGNTSFVAQGILEFLSR